LAKLTDIISIFTGTEMIYYCVIHKNRNNHLLLPYQNMIS